MVIRNGRDRDFALDRDGFRFVRHDTKVGDFFDEEEVRASTTARWSSWYRRAAPCAWSVFDHTLRTADDELRETRKIREVVRRVHNDYTEWSGPQRVRDILPAEADDLLRRRFAIIQVWRPIRTRSRAFRSRSRRAACRRMISSSPSGAIPTGSARPTPSPTIPITAWYWFLRMRRDEALVFKVYDSLKDGRARWTAHTAFEDPTSPPDARPRESIEIRTLAFF